VRSPRPFAAPAQRVEPLDHIWRSLTVKTVAHVERRLPLEVLSERYGENEISTQTKAVFDVITRTATAPADTTTSGWASQLVQTSIQGFFGALMPNSVYPALAAKGSTFTFGRNGTITIPSRVSTPTVAGSFVAQGGAIPVRKGAFTSLSLTPKKMGVISTLTREIAEHSTPAIEALIRQAIIDDTSVAIDTILLDSTAADTTRPAGLLNGITAATGGSATGSTMAALLTDLRALTSALITGTNGNVRNPVWLMNPGDVLAAQLTPAVAGGGEFPFKQELTGGTMLGYPVIASTNVTQDMVVLLDAADFVTVTGETPRFDVSDQAVIHEETTPGAIATGTTAGVVAYPVRSLWQTDTLGIRMILDINWALRRTGIIKHVTAINWAP
jgi:HK97 family phage major capsid protein